MQKIASKVVLATATIVFNLGFFNLKAAEAITFALDWTGQFGGYSAEGLFSYDENNIPEDGIIRKDNLTSFDLAIFDPDGNLLENFIDNHLIYPGFNFNFDTTTNTILQDGRYDSPTGLDIGFSENVSGFPKGSIVTGEPRGLSIWSSGPFEPLGVHVHLSGYGEQYAQLPISFHGLMDFLDIAFYTLTQQQALEALGQDGSSADNVILGQRLRATQVPESSPWLGIVMSGITALLIRKARL